MIFTCIPHAQFPKNQPSKIGVCIINGNADFCLEMEAWSLEAVLLF